MIKILQITGNSNYGGAGYLLHEWCKFLNEKKCQVDVLTTDSHVKNKLSSINGISIIDTIYIPREISPYYDIVAFFQLLRFLKKKKYDIVHTYTSTPGLLGRFTARIQKVPVILHHQAGWTVNEFSTPYQRLLYTPLEYFASAMGTKSICVSHAVHDQARHLRIAPPNKLTTILNGIDPQPFIQTPEHQEIVSFRVRHGLDSRPCLIGNTGRLSIQKDNQSLLRAIPYLRKEKPEGDFAVVLAGDGPERTNLKKMIQQERFEPYVYMLGFIEEIPLFLSAIQIFVSPSLWEGLSISLLEAMSAELPIITTNIPPNAELIEHEVTGLLVPPRDPEAIAKAILRFMREPELACQCARNARKKVIEKYHINRMFEETWRLYTDLLKDRKH